MCLSSSLPSFFSDYSSLNTITSVLTRSVSFSSFLALLSAMNRPADPRTNEKREEEGEGGKGEGSGGGEEERVLGDQHHVPFSSLRFLVMETFSPSVSPGSLPLHSAS